MKKEAMLYTKLDDKKVQCDLCSHRCKIADSKYGICGVRKNESGTLYTYAYGEVIAAHVDPIEKKPLYHFLPGSLTYSIATEGCNFRCGFCQNWQISQRSKRNGELKGYELKPSGVVREARRSGSRSISSTYTEPTVFFEYAYDTAKIAKEEGLFNTFVTNGYMTKDAIESISPYLDACNVDLKSFDNNTYKNVCGGSLEPVLESIRIMKRAGIWVEITTLIVPGMNDDKGGIEELAYFISEVGKEIPWHISRFHPDYKYLDTNPTPQETLQMAERIGKEAGLKYIYVGNVATDSNTHCFQCGEQLITRLGYMVTENKINNGKCSSCNCVIEGVW